MTDQARHPERSSALTVEALYRFVLPAALLCFIGAVLTDWAYARTATIGYSNASAWLLLFGLLAGGLVIAFVALSFLGGWLDRRRLWLTFALFAVGLIVEVINFMIHNRDGWTTVVPTGIALSIIGAVILLAASWLGRTPVVERGA